MRGHEETDGVRADEEPPAGPDVDVTAHRSSPDRIVFTEEENTDGWIATDLTVSLER
jgi:hypothetical protein